MWFYLLWVPLTIIYYIAYAYLSKQYNEGECKLWVFYLINLVPIWVLVARYSKNIIFDGLLYDFIMFFVFFLTLAVLGSGEKFSIFQWIGLFFAICGFLMMKLF